MSKLFVCLLLTISVLSYGQTEILRKYKVADSLAEHKHFAAAYPIFKEIEAKCNTGDTLYSYILWSYTNTVSRMEKAFRYNQQFDSSLQYSMEALKLIQKGKPFYDETFAKREPFMIKNIIVSYFGLGQLENADKYKAMLYQAYKDKTLPEGIDKSFNFSFYKWEGKNVWGYEYFEELPEDRFSKSFSKILYYVYSTNPDGSDKDQLYTLHVLMFHNIDTAVKIDYVLTKRLATATDEVSGTFYAYTYTKDIDYRKLQADIKEVLKGNYEGDSRSVIKRK